MSRNNEKQAAGLRLSKDSTTNEVKTYFSKIFELKQSGKEFSINLNDVWPLAYANKHKAVEILKSEFVQNEDYIVQKSENQRLTQKGESNIGGNLRQIDYYLSVPCLEYFIAKRVKSIFEVYRQVFHKAIETAQESKQITQKASMYQEETLISVPLGDEMIRIWVRNGVIYAPASRIMRYIGYESGVSAQFRERFGEHFISVNVNEKQSQYFVSLAGFVEMAKYWKVSTEKYHNILIMYGDREPEPLPEWAYCFTEGEMLNLIGILNRRPLNRHDVIEILLNSKKR